MSLTYILIPIALGAVVLVLVLGIMNLARGGSPERSQKLMQARVILQFVAIAAVLLVVWLASR